MGQKDENILTDDQAKLVRMLLDGRTQKEIAEEFGVHVNTIWNRKNNSVVQKALKEAKRTAIHNAQLKFIGKAAWAAQKIIDMVDNPDATRVQFQAACKVYDSSVGVTVEDLEERIIALEEQVTREV